MKSVAPGNGIFDIEVREISSEGFQLLFGRESLFVSFDQFPWFRIATPVQIKHVELHSAHHLHWPDPDVDLDVESIRHPEKFPLVSDVNP